MPSIVPLVLAERDFLVSDAVFFRPNLRTSLRHSRGIAHRCGPMGVDVAWHQRPAFTPRMLRLRGEIMKRLASRRSRFAALLAAGFFAGGAIALCSVARAEHGRFDRTEVNPRDEAYIFTPAGFTEAGKPAVAESPHAARLNVTIVDAGTGKPTPCRVNVVGSDGNFYQPRDNPLSPYSLDRQLA